jgi:heme oxygenase
MTGAAGSVRRAVAAETRAAHEALHHHPWISRLGQHDLTLTEYSLILTAYLGFFQWVEAARKGFGLPDALSLHLAIAALHTDCNALCPTPGMHRASTLSPDLWLLNGPQVLGALYVLHGAGFGAGTLARAISKSLPDATCAYFEAGTPVPVWRDLVRHLEEAGQEPEGERQILQGALATFGSFGRHVTALCEGSPAGRSVRRSVSFGAGDASGLPGPRSRQADPPAHRSIHG